jgi:hypothetical protein
LPLLCRRLTRKPALPVPASTEGNGLLIIVVGH